MLEAYSLRLKMTNPKKLRELMKTAIRIAKKSKDEDKSVHPKVGAVIADESGGVVATGYRGERGKGDHAEFVAISKAKEKGFSDFSGATLFATLEPCTHRGASKTPCAQRIVQAGFRNVYIGALDPNPAIVGHGETYLRQREGMTVERFPSDLERLIRELNAPFWRLFATAHLPTTSMYVTTRVSDIILQELRAAGIDVDYLPSDSDYTLRDLAAFVRGKGKFRYDRKDLPEFLGKACAKAFDEKYSQYTYANDARRIEERWKAEFKGILKRFRIYEYPAQRIVNVGIGNGIEGVGLFEECAAFVGVDIASESLKLAQAKFPRASFFQNHAERMIDLDDATQDIYMSLRTYQSAFFDMQEAIREAHRVLAPGGIAVISIANAYLEGNTFVRGLMPHGSKTIDQDRAHKLIFDIRHSLSKLRFDEVGVHSGRAEEYVFGRKRH